MSSRSEHWLNQRLAFGLRVARSEIHGWGCFATIFFRRNQQIAEYVGERISLKEAERRRESSRNQCICDVDTEWAIDGSRGGNGTQYVNHSCQPNSEVIVLDGRIFLYALREINPGEEITTEYLYELGLEGTRCNCRMTFCWNLMSPAAITAELVQVGEKPTFRHDIKALRRKLA